MNVNRSLALFAVLSLALAACGGASDVQPEVGDAGTPTSDQPTLIARGGTDAEDSGSSGGTQDDSTSGDDASGSDSSGETSDEQPTEVMRRTESVQLQSPEYGVQAFLWWRPELAERDMLVVKDMGFGWIKQGFGWRDIELSKGDFDWSHTDHIVDTAMRYGGLELVVRVDHQPEWARSGCSMQGPPNDLNDLADFLKAVASEYKGQIAAYQIWNEPNLAREWCDQAPDPAAYAEMLRVAYAAIKAADPNAYVISAGMAPTGTLPPTAMPDDDYLDQLYQAMGGSSDGHFDILGVHAPGYAAPPETSPEEAAASEAYGGERYFTFRRVEDLRAIQESYGDGDTPMAVLEMGWTSDPVHPEYAWHAVDEDTKADYLVRAYQYAAANWQPWMTIMTTIYVCNPDWTEADEQYWWCITDPDGTPRPAFESLKAMEKEQY